MGLKSLTIEKKYRSNKCNIVKDFYIPCLSKSNIYQRAVGYFTSGGLNVAAKGLEEFIKGNGYMQLVTSPYLEEKDVNAINEGLANQDKAILDSLLRELEKIENESEDEKTNSSLFCLSTLIASGRLEIKLSLPVDEHNKLKSGIYHEKFGIFKDDNGDEIGFHGSSNETVGGLVENFESILVFRSWNDPEERIKGFHEDFDELWEDNTPGAKIFTFPEAAKKKLIQIKQHKYPETSSGEGRISDTGPTEEATPNKWRHQDEAVEAFLDAKRGILEMATGTGKTRTALKILSRLIEDNLIDSCIVTTDGNDLLEQWCTEIYKTRTPYRILRHFSNNHERMEYTYDPIKSILVISRQKLPKVLEKLSNEVKKRLFIIHDEVHGLGSPSNFENLQNKLGATPFRLGLSATPEREYDEQGSDFIKEHIGDVIYRFELEDAIKRGILCEFNYYPLQYHITSDDKQKLQSIYKLKAAREEAGSPMSDAEIWMKIAAVYKTSEAKLPIVEDFINSNPNLLDRCIVFVETMTYGEKVLDIVHRYKHDFHTYYTGEDSEKLVKFAKGRINCLITCHRLSQGIDIQSLESVILFSSNRSKLETIQRMGRCLRIDPNNPGLQ